MEKNLKKEKKGRKENVKERRRMKSPEKTSFLLNGNRR